MTTHTRPAALAAALAFALGCSGSDDRATAPRVFFTDPVSPLHVRAGAVALRVFVDGVPERVDLYKDGAPLVNLGSNGHYEYAWSADGAPEGVHRFTARAQLGGKVEESAPVDVVVDRTPPSIAGSAPAAGATRVPLDAPLALTFSEPLDPASLVEGVSVRIGEAVRPAALVRASTAGTYEVSLPGGLWGDGEVALVPAPTLRDLAGNALGAAEVRFSLLTWSALGGGPDPVSWCGAPVALLSRGLVVATSAGCFRRPEGGAWTDALPYAHDAVGQLLAAAEADDGIWALSHAGSELRVQRFGPDRVEAFAPIATANAGFSIATWEGSIALVGGRPVVSWVEYTAPASGASVFSSQVRALDAEGGWQRAEPPQLQSGFLAASAGERLFATWFTSQGAAAGWLGAAGWEPLPAPGGIGSADVALAQDGTPVVVSWQPAAYALAGAEWTTVGHPSSAPGEGEGMGELALAAGADARSVLAGWLFTAADGRRTVSASLRAGGGFLPIARGVGEGAYWIDVAFDQGGAPLLAWSESGAVHLRRLDP